MAKRERPERDEYYMGIAMAVRQRANCHGNRVGAVLVKDDRVIATGYNGTPQGMTNCEDGGCIRCEKRDEFRSGEGYDLCICVHAEQNALLSAARFGVAVEGADLYTTMQPCFGCAKELIQARVRAIYYLHEWQYPDPRMEVEYNRIMSHLDHVEQLDMHDEEETWAVTNKRER